MLEELLWSNSSRVASEDSGSGNGWSFLRFIIVSFLFEGMSTDHSSAASVIFTAAQ